MRYRVLFAKEMTELWRSYRLVALAAVLVGMGILSPVGARFLPDLIGQMSTPGITIQMPTPTVADGNAQFVKNISQIGMMVLILIVMGSVARERERGTAAMVLCKPASRAAFLAAKASALALGLVVSLLLSALMAYVYTLLLLGDVPLTQFLGMTALVGLYLLVIAASTFFASAVLRSPLAAGGVGFLVTIVLSLVGSIPRLGKFLPGELMGWALRAGSGQGPTAWGSLAVSLGLIAAFLVGAWVVFRKVEL
jgi:ABC-2 type transport system permease protein